MEKPTVFLSHSSRDARSLVSLKEMLNKKTSGTLRLFLSSDGQSIPFGRNWVATVEAALDSSAVGAVDFKCDFAEGAFGVVPAI